jgi:hypothetical protein
MRKSTLISLVAAGLALFPAAVAFSAAPDPTPNRESKLLVDFENTTTVTSDPDAAGTNLASTNTDAQFVAEGTKSLKLDLNGIGNYKDYFVIDLPQPVDIQGFQVLSMDVYAPNESLNNGDLSNTWFQFDPRPTTTTSLTDDTATGEVQYGPVNMHPGWNRMIWTLKKGTDTKITRLAFAGNTNPDLPYTGPLYVDNIRVYKGDFTGLQPDEKLISGFDNAADKDAFSGASPVDINTDKQFIRDGTGSLKVDLTGATSGWTNDVARADDLGTTPDLSNATALHLDVYVPEGSYVPTDWHEIGFGVVGEGGEIWGSTTGVQNVADQWITLEIPLTPDQATTLGHPKGVFLLRNSGNDWTGPIYIDNLRAVVPPAPTAGG